MALAESCGVPEAGAAEVCNASNVDRWDCTVMCMEDAECSAIDGSVITQDGWGGEHSEYIECMEACPGIYLGD